MDNLIDACESVLNELRKFSTDVLSLGPKIEDDRLEHFEKKIGYILPFEFKYIIKQINGFSINGKEVLGIDNELRESSLDRVYDYEHLENGNKMYPELLPFSPDGYGNHYCLDLSTIRNGVSSVLFWQHDYGYSSKAEIEICNGSFIEWIKEVMIDWTLEDYDYDGSEK